MSSNKKVVAALLPVEIIPVPTATALSLFEILPAAGDQVDVGLHAKFDCIRYEFDRSSGVARFEQVARGRSLKTSLIAFLFGSTTNDLCTGTISYTPSECHSLKQQQ